ncbi:MAG: nitroreductase [Clostridia bacterium]|nr:nitroreductase [Clostridia bacterium]
MSNMEGIVKARHSVRSFTDQKIEGEVLTELQKALDEANAESGLQIKLALNEEKAFGEGHYGQFHNCKNYICIIGDKDLKNLEEVSGYYGEKIALKAQELGLNTCWVALTYKKSEVPFELKDSEKIVIVIATGYGVNQGSAHKMKDFSSVSKTAENESPEWYKKGIEYALHAPTAINQQKFVFELKNQNEVSAKAKLGPCSKIDLGIVKYHFELGAGKENFKWN